MNSTNSSNVNTTVNTTTNKNTNEVANKTSKTTRLSFLLLKICLWLFCGFLVLQGLLLVPFYYYLEKGELKRLEDMSIGIVRTLLVSLQVMENLKENLNNTENKELNNDPNKNLNNVQNKNLPKEQEKKSTQAQVVDHISDRNKEKNLNLVALEIISNISNDSPLKGLIVTRLEGSPVVYYGEKPGYPQNHMSKIEIFLSSSREKIENRYNLAWEADELKLPFEVRVRMDSGAIQPHLNSILLKMVVWIILSAIIFMGFCLYILQKKLFVSLNKLNQNLISYTADLENPQNHLMVINNKTPMGEMLKKINELFKRCYQYIKTIKAHESIMQLSIEERTQVLDRITNYDLVTGLANRNLLVENLNKFIEHANVTNKQAFVILVELRDFHEIINSFGQEASNVFLQNIGKLLAENTPAGSTIAHLSLAQFAVARNNLATVYQASNLAQGILDLLTKPFKIEDQNILCTINIGVAIYPNDALDADNLLTQANIALTRSKTESPNSFQFYESSMNQTLKTRRTLLADLHFAVERDEFCIFYQPQIDLKSDQLIGLEALIRWQHPEKGILFPWQFISLAEESGLITQIGEKILKTACLQTKAWQDQGYKNLSVAVNLSAIQFKQKNIVEIVYRILSETDLPPENLELEITENGLINSPKEAIITMKALHALGIILSLDDFGTGYSSLSYLKRFPVQKLKIDQSFVQDLGKVSSNEKPLADIIILLGHSLNLKVIAEGVEDESTLNYLKEKGCDEVQGYYFGKPTSAKDCPKLFEKLGLKPSGLILDSSLK